MLVELRLRAQVLEEVLIHVLVDGLWDMRGSACRSDADLSVEVCDKDLIVLQIDRVKGYLRQ